MDIKVKQYTSTASVPGELAFLRGATSNAIETAYNEYIYRALVGGPAFRRGPARKKRNGPSYRQRQKAGKAARADSLRRNALRGS